jgi:hypothetical protein
MADTRSGKHQEQHFADEDWVDFDRQERATARMARLRRHLETGCRRCAETLRFWQRVRSTAAREASYRPPQADPGQLRGLLAAHKAKASLNPTAIRPVLVFDSFGQPLPTGVRGGGSSPRQLLYKGGRFTVKLQVEPDAGSNRLSIIGQIFDDQDPTRGLQDIVVLVLKGSSALDRTLTNRYGEFQLEPDSADNLLLSVGVDEIGTFTVQSGGPTERTALDPARAAFDGAVQRTDARGR